MNANDQLFLHELGKRVSALESRDITYAEKDSWRWRTHEHTGPWNEGLPTETERNSRGYKDWIEYRLVGAPHIIRQSLAKVSTQAQPQYREPTLEDASDLLSVTWALRSEEFLIALKKKGFVRKVQP